MLAPKQVPEGRKRSNQEQGEGVFKSRREIERQRTTKLTKREDGTRLKAKIGRAKIERRVRLEGKRREVNSKKGTDKKEQKN